MLTINEDDIKLQQSAADKSTAIQGIAKSLANNNLVERDYVQGMLDRESQNSTYLGNGIAIPNIYSSELDQRICFVISLSEGLQIQDKDETIDCIFLLLSPLGDFEGHLATLSDISKCCRNTRHTASRK